jgi:hypothetical protein
VIIPNVHRHLYWNRRINNKINSSIQTTNQQSKSTSKIYWTYPAPVKFLQTAQQCTNVLRSSPGRPKLTILRHGTSPTVHSLFALSFSCIILCLCLGQWIGCPTPQPFPTDFGRMAKLTTVECAGPLVLGRERLRTASTVQWFVFGTFFVADYFRGVLPLPATTNLHTSLSL